MKGLDTNALIRFLVRDNEEQAQAVRSLFIEAAKKNEPLFVPLAVTLEVIWVLSSAYDYSKEEIVDALNGLLVLPMLTIEEHDRIAYLCRFASRTTAGLADLLIGLSARDKGCSTTLTFDKKAAQSELFTLIG
jgi:predicted nucleic-acid-binding protein